MRPNPSFILAILTAMSVPLPAQSVNDVGLTMDGGVLMVIHGQPCGSVPCTPFPGGTVGVGDPRTVTHYGALSTPFVLVIGFPVPCYPFPGIANTVQVAAPVTLTVGIAANPSPLSVCRQGWGSYSLTLPANAPAGFVFRLQSLGVSNSGQLALGPSIEAVTR